MAVYDQVKQVADSYGIPDWVWYPILILESGANPNARTVSDSEDSRGLFQINTKAHPQYDPNKLYDPTYNATIAIRDFIAPAYAQVQSSSESKGAKTAYVWKYGIRPAWDQTKENTIVNVTDTFAATGHLPVLKDAGANAVGNTIHDWLLKPFGKSLETDISPTKPYADQINSFLDWWKNFTQGGGVLNLVVLIVGLVLLVMVLKSMFLGGAIAIVQGKGSAA